MTNDRRVHATSPGETLVIARYDRGGKYWIESNVDATREPCDVHTAAKLAARWALTGGVVHWDRPGGRAFDPKVKRYMEDMRSAHA